MEVELELTLTSKFIELASPSVNDCWYYEYSIHEFSVEEGGFDDVSLFERRKGGKEKQVGFRLNELSSRAEQDGLWGGEEEGEGTDDVVPSEMTVCVCAATRKGVRYSDE